MGVAGERLQNGQSIYEEPGGMNFNRQKQRIRLHQGKSTYKIWRQKTKGHVLATASRFANV